MKKLLLMVVIALSPAVAQASVTLNMSIGFLSTNDGSLLADGSTLTLLADTNGNGFGDLTQATSSWTGDPEDILLARFPSNGFLAGTGTSFDAITFEFEGLEVGDPMLLVWYDLPYDSAAEGPGEAVEFGTYRDDQPRDGANIGWNVPADGATVGLNFVTTNVGGSVDDALGQAQFSTVGVIPEPATALVTLLGGALVMTRSRNRKSG